jgi:hypothetical protein
MGMSTSPASATEAAPQLQATVRAAMVVDCSTLTIGQLKNAQAHGACGSVQDPPLGALGHFNAAYGNCGYVYFYLYDDYNGGTVVMNNGGQSYLGGINYVDYTWHWNNWQQGTSGGYTNLRREYGSTTWYDQDSAWTFGPGYVTGSQSGYAVLLDGTQCTFLPTSDSTYVT